MFGRADERAAIHDLVLDGARLVTITGTAGVGKTRLAIAIGEASSARYGGRVRFVDLATVTDPGLVVPTVAASLGLAVPHGAGGALDAFIGASPDTPPTLVILDNFEQVVAAGPDLAYILAYCSWLQMLITSRERLRLRGEHEIELLPFPVPAATPDLTVAAARTNPAVALFVHSARAVQPHFDVDDTNLGTVVELVRRLDGVPLAVELAAGHLKVLSTAEILNLLRQRLDALAAGPRDLPERQRTLRSALDWSHRLLDAGEGRLFRTLSVFRGGCDLASLAAVAGVRDTAEVLPAVQSLLDKSLVLRVSVGDTPRLAMLEYVRQYAAEQLERADDAETVRAAHGARFAALAVELGSAHGGAQGGQGRRLARLEADHDNFRAALEWVLAQPGRNGASMALTMSVALAEFWFMRGYFDEGAHWLRAAMSTAGPDAPPGLLAAASAAAGRIAFGQGRYDEASACYQDAIDRAGHADLPAERAAALTGLAEVHAYLGVYGPALDLLKESLAIRERIGDIAGRARATNSLALLYLHQGRNEQALELFERGLELFGQLDDTWGMAWSMSNAADAERALDRPVEAVEHYRRALDLAAEIGLSAAVAAALEGLSALDVHQGRFEAATMRYAAAQAVRQSIGSSTSPTRRATLERLVGTARAALGDERFTAAWERGRATAPASLAETPPDAAPPVAEESAPDALLSQREREVALLAARGLTNRLVAKELGISENTVGRHLENIYRKLAVRSRTELAAWGYHGGLPELSAAETDTTR
ncbi:tetratricopeptide repeat protein [Jiangella aurantiaca]|uniref:Tetratricopeptide repeat protein n=1 Tax=Jiangella aurantiaca TaxID=2530373 RepID=A0A4R5ABR0_9ACTN|nr:tetratricopeptide repeat protein [Jiangella aurantiaca]TDD69818.1 tetratricopeptide repeat protein [Jiangella aurantiaca]